MQFGDGQESSVIGHRADDHDGFVSGAGFAADFGVGGDAGEGNWGTVDARHEETAENDFIKVGVGAA